MPDSFAARLALLRKEARISQKDAAAALGISQALLSHYENGIRECGPDFIIRAAQFYGVTCDYLLGLQSDKYGVGALFGTADALPDDDTLCAATLYRAAHLLHEQLGNIAGETLSLYSTYLYRILLYGICKGMLPANWLEISGTDEAQSMQAAADALHTQMTDVHRGKTALIFSDKPMPPCLQTVVREAAARFQNCASALSDALQNKEAQI